MATVSGTSRIWAQLNGRFLLSVLGILIAAVFLTTVISPIAVILVGIMLVVVRYFLPVSFTFVLGQFMLAGLFSISTFPSQFVGAEIGLFIALVGPALLDEAPIQMLVATLTTLVGLGAISWATLQSTDALWPVGLVLVGSTALVAYGLHRYEQVQLGLIEVT